MRFCRRRVGLGRQNFPATTPQRILDQNCTIRHLSLSVWMCVHAEVSFFSVCFGVCLHLCLCVFPKHKCPFRVGCVYSRLPLPHSFLIVTLLCIQPCAYVSRSACVRSRSHCIRIHSSVSEWRLHVPSPAICRCANVRIRVHAKLSRF